jgi:hypothetical protein
MSVYQRGKIYKITSDQTDEIYIGSTCEKYLSNRIAKHRTNYRAYLQGKHNYVSSYEIVKHDDAQIELIECFPCNSKEELFARERELQREHNHNTVNIIRPIVTKEEVRAERKKYREDHKDEIAKWKKQWYQDNIETVKIKRRQYRQDNADMIKEQKKASYARNKEKRKIKFMCICGIEARKRDKARHEKSVYHRQYIEREQELERQCKNALQDIFD